MADQKKPADSIADEETAKTTTTKKAAAKKTAAKEEAKPEETKASKTDSADATEPKETAAEKKTRVAAEKAAKKAKDDADKIPDAEEQAKQNGEPGPVEPIVEQPSQEQIDELNEKAKQAASREIPDDALIVLDTGVMPQENIRFREQFVVGFNREVLTGSVIAPEDGESQYRVIYAADIYQSGMQTAYSYLIDPIKLEGAYVNKEEFGAGKYFTVIKDVRSE